MIHTNITFKELKKKEVQNHKDVVFEILYWLETYCEEYENCSYHSGGLYTFSVDSIDENTFIPFDNVTKETILEWILKSENVYSIQELGFVRYTVEYVENRIKEIENNLKVDLEGWIISTKEMNVGAGTTVIL